MLLYLYLFYFHIQRKKPKKVRSGILFRLLTPHNFTKLFSIPHLTPKTPAIVAHLKLRKTSYSISHGDPFRVQT